MQGRLQLCCAMEQPLLVVTTWSIVRPARLAVMSFEEASCIREFHNIHEWPFNG